MSRSIRSAAWVLPALALIVSSAHADGGDTPGSGPIITQAQIEAGIVISGDTRDNTDVVDSGYVPLTFCRPSTAPDEWYTLSITSTIDVNITMIAPTDYNFKIFVRDAVGEVIACARSLGFPLHDLRLTPGLYDLAIDGWHPPPSGIYTAEIGLSDPPPPPCFLPNCDGTPEGEPCDDVGPDTTNGGCTSTPNAFGTIAPGETVCGTTWAHDGRHDTDWYVISPPLGSLLVTLYAEVDTTAFIVELSPGGVCPVINTFSGTPAVTGGCNFAAGYPCMFPASNPVLVVTPGSVAGGGIFDGFPCPDGSLTNNAYQVTVNAGFLLTPPPCPWDFNENNAVDFADVLLIVSNWGPCPGTDKSADRRDPSDPMTLTERAQPVDRDRTSRPSKATHRTRSSGATAAGAGNTPGSGPIITGAQIIAGPVPIAGDTSNNTDAFDVGPLTTPPTDCGASTAPDAWYTISIDAGTGPLPIDIDLCEDANGDPLNLTGYDSKIFVLDAQQNPLQCNDETGCSTGSGPSALLNLQLDPGDYEVAIDGFGTASGVYGGQIRIFVPNMCFLDPPCTGPTEGEVCDEVAADNFNGGCNSTPEAFSVAAIDQKVCGVNWGNNGLRDTDWWLFSNTVLNAYELRVRAEADTVVFLAKMSPGGACPVIGIPSGIPAYSGDCDTTNILGDDYVLDPGDYIMFVGTGTAAGGGVFDGFPCPDGTTTNNAYEVEIANVPLPPPPCPYDLNGNHSIDFADLLILLNEWGDCPEICPPYPPPSWLVP